MSRAHKISRSGRRQRGQALTEFALVMPILLLVLMAVIDFGWAIFNYAQLYNSLREGLRYASVPGEKASSPQYKNCSGIKSRITALAGSSGVKSTNITITYDTGSTATQVGTCTTSFAQSGSRDVQNGDRIVINVNLNLQFLTPIMRPFASNGLLINLTASRTLYPNGLTVQ
jgi:Flp pilus assembly protein TadG